MWPLQLLERPLLGAEVPLPLQPFFYPGPGPRVLEMMESAPHLGPLHLHEETGSSENPQPLPVKDHKLTDYRLSRPSGPSGHDLRLTFTETARLTLHRRCNVS